MRSKYTGNDWNLMTKTQRQHAIHNLKQWRTKAGLYSKAEDNLNSIPHILDTYYAEIDLAKRIFGDGDGVLISGVYREHFPESVKYMLRYLIQRINETHNVAKLYWIASGKRQSTFNAAYMQMKQQWADSKKDGAK